MKKEPITQSTSDLVVRKQDPQNAIIKSEEQKTIVQNFDMNTSMPDLDELQEVPFDLMSSYWTPEKVGESKRLLFSHIAIREILDQNTGEIVHLPCAYFYEQVGSGSERKVQQISNGSKRLVGMCEMNKLKQGDAILISYIGKKKNVNNPNSSDNWSVKPLILKLR